MESRSVYSKRISWNKGVMWEDSVDIAVGSWVTPAHRTVPSVHADALGSYLAYAGKPYTRLWVAYGNFREEELSYVPQSYPKRPLISEIDA